MRRAHLSGALTAAQHDAIRRGLGDPPARNRPPAHNGRDAENADHAGTAEDAAVVGAAWGIAAEQLMAEADAFPVEELLRRARQVRDALDPEGTEERFAERFTRRSFRIWIDPDGTHRAAISFDDEMAAWVHAIIDAALRPRRGGPRFVDPREAAAADALVTDPRTNEQLSYYLMTDILRAGAVATTDQVFGTRQPGIRLVTVTDTIGPRDALGRLTATAHLEDRGDAVPGSILDRALCTTGTIDVTVDTYGNPLDVGRDHRLFTPRQRLALAIRDGGCLFPGCPVPASYTEAHHIDHWHQDHGRTDTDRGILLCRFHHLTLHTNGWRIHRHDKRTILAAPPARTRTAHRTTLPIPAPLGMGPATHPTTRMARHVRHRPDGRDVAAGRRRTVSEMSARWTSWQFSIISASPSTTSPARRRSSIRCCRRSDTPGTTRTARSHGNEGRTRN